MPKMTPAQALPLLEQMSNWSKTFCDEALRSQDFSKAQAYAETFFKKTQTILREIDDLSDDLFGSFQREREHPRSTRDAPEPIYLNSIMKGHSALSTIIQIIRIQARKPPHGSSVMAIGSKVFIGHGRNPAWMELDKFLEKDLHIEVVEFNSQPTAGGTVIDRLKTMLNSVGFALLVMTAEDHVGTRKDGIRARQNVIHEIGLFQGRLGFDKAIILLEDECERFSNIDGLIYIPFPKGNIRAAFHDIQKTLTAAGLVKPVAP